MDTFNDYLEDALASDDIDLSDIGSIIALALLDAGGDLDKSFEALERARMALSKTKLAGEAAELIGAALHHVEVAIEFSDT